MIQVDYWFVRYFLRIFRSFWQVFWECVKLIIESYSINGIKILNLWEKVRKGRGYWEFIIVVQIFCFNKLIIFFFEC